MGGMWCVNVGYGRDEIADAMAAQAKRMCYYSPFSKNSTEPAIEFAHRIAKYAPGDLNRVFFTTCGSTAVDSALRFIHLFQLRRGQKTAERHIISRDRCLSRQHLPDRNALRQAGRQAALSLRDGFRASFVIAQSLSAADGHERGAIRRPVRGRAGEQHPGSGPGEGRLLLRRADAGVRRRDRAAAGLSPAHLGDLPKYDVLYFSDEVVTGFGRLGQCFASEDVFDIEPDLIVSAKGLVLGLRAARRRHRSTRSTRACWTRRARARCSPTASPIRPIRSPARPASRPSRSWSATICGHVREWGPYFREQLARSTT